VEECTKANSGICRQTRHKFEKVRPLLPSLGTAVGVQRSKSSTTASLSVASTSAG
jgi:hypothetical protein